LIDPEARIVMLLGAAEEPVLPASQASSCTQYVPGGGVVGVPLPFQLCVAISQAQPPSTIGRPVTAFSMPAPFGSKMKSAPAQ
jgi:hypothetical protein